jgi:hypothetical protein
MTPPNPRSCWQNCSGADEETLAIDAMEDALAPLDESAVEIRRLITGFEACYHEADKEAEFIVRAIGAGGCPPRSNERPPQRKRELEDSRGTLAAWCANPGTGGPDRDVGGLGAEQLRRYLGEPNPLKNWQVARVVDRISHALDPNHPYHNLALSLGPYGEPGPDVSAAHYPGQSAFLGQTRQTLIHDTLNGRPSQVSLAFAIDLLMPCGWDFIGCLTTILGAIGGDLYPQRPLACCARNLRLSPLCGRLMAISLTLQAFWKHDLPVDDLDHHLLASLGTPTPVKCWLAASLDKTIRLHLSQPFDIDLF